MAKKVMFEGQEYAFPDDATDSEMSTALGKLNIQVKSTEPKTSAEDENALFAKQDEQQAPSTGGDVQPQGGANESSRNASEGATDTASQSRVSSLKQESLNEDERIFRDKIVKIESGGLAQPYARTGIRPEGGQSGSSAYGPAQITKGLIVNYLTKRGKLFEDSEVEAMLNLMDRQKVALKIGGRDRESYEKGGSNAAYADFMAEQYGYDTVEEFLDAFDYSGDLGLSKDNQFKLQYENFSRKMLKDTLKEAKGDQLLAASVWHGGENWKTAASKGDTKRYRDKFERL